MIDVNLGADPTGSPAFVSEKRLLSIPLVLLMIISPNLASAASVKILESEVSVGLNYEVGWSDVVFTDSATAVSSDNQPIVMLLGAEHSTPQYQIEAANLGPQAVTVTQTASGSMAYANQPGVA